MTIPLPSTTTLLPVHHAPTNLKQYPNGWYAFKDLTRLVSAIEWAVLSKPELGAPRGHGLVTARTGLSYKYVNVRIDLRSGDFNLTDEANTRIATSDELLELFPRLGRGANVMTEDWERDVTAFVDGHLTRWNRVHSPMAPTFEQDVKELVQHIREAIHGDRGLESIQSGIKRHVAAQAMRYFA